MGYFCYDCSYSGKMNTGAGRCPACGSINVKRAKGKDGTQQSPQRRRFGLLAVVLLWGYLIVHIIWKLNAR